MGKLPIMRHKDVVESKVWDIFAYLRKQVRLSYRYVVLYRVLVYTGLVAYKTKGMKSISYESSQVVAKNQMYQTCEEM